jgi:hypothetical protein
LTIDREERQTLSSLEIAGKTISLEIAFSGKAILLELLLFQGLLIFPLWPALTAFYHLLVR